MCKSRFATRTWNDCYIPYLLWLFCLWSAADVVPHSFLSAKQGHSDEMKSYRITCAEGSFSCVDLYARAQQMPSPHHGGWHVTVWPSLSLSLPLSLSLSLSLFFLSAGLRGRLATLRRLAHPTTHLFIKWSVLGIPDYGTKQLNGIRFFELSPPP